MEPPETPGRFTGSHEPISYSFTTLRSLAEERLMAESRDKMPAATGHGHLRASHADREQVISSLKAAECEFGAVPR